MKFSEKYPGRGHLEEVDIGIMRVNGSPHRCCVCGKLTNYIEINYEAPFCSEECLRAFEEGVDEDLS